MYYGNYESVGGSLITVLMNRLGDCMIVVIFFWVVMLDQEWVVSIVRGFSVISVMVVIAVVTKSAQFPYSIWLPLAMAAPTPVSALVHSSTLVTAGVYFIIRWYSVITNASLMILYVISFATIIYSGLVIVGESDLKKVVALSTLIHLGIMISMVSLGSCYLGFIHMILHAVYKSILFVCVGVLIVNMIHEQSFCGYSGVIGISGLNTMAISIRIVSLAGLPFFSGFYTKEIVVAVVIEGSLNVVMVGMGLLGLSIRLLYSVRLVMVSFRSSVVRRGVNCVFVINKLFMRMIVVYSIISVVFGYLAVMTFGWVFRVGAIRVSEVVFYYLSMFFVFYIF